MPNKKNNFDYVDLVFRRHELRDPIALRALTRNKATKLIFSSEGLKWSSRNIFLMNRCCKLVLNFLIVYDLLLNFLANRRIKIKFHWRKCSFLQGHVSNYCVYRVPANSLDLGVRGGQQNATRHFDHRGAFSCDTSNDG